MNWVALTTIAFLNWSHENVSMFWTCIALSQHQVMFQRTCSKIRVFFIHFLTFSASASCDGPWVKSINNPIHSCLSYSSRARWVLLPWESPNRRRMFPGGSFFCSIQKTQVWCTLAWPKVLKLDIFYLNHGNIRTLCISKQEWNYKR